MAGRGDFGVIKSRALTDQRFRDLARELRKDTRLLEALAQVTARGLVAHLGLWAMRETDDGILPGDGVLPLSAAAGVGEADAERAVALLRAAGVELLRPAEGGLYLTGFLEAYEPVLRERFRGRDRRKDPPGPSTDGAPGVHGREGGSPGTGAPSTDGKAPVRGRSAGRPDGRTGRAVPAGPDGEEKAAPGEGKEGGAPRTDPFTEEDSGRHELSLSSPQRAELMARGIRLNRRTGSAAGWEKELRVRLASGVPWEALVARLEATKDQPALPAFRVFAPLDPPPPTRGRGPATPPGEDPGAPFRGIGRTARGR